MLQGKTSVLLKEGAGKIDFVTVFKLYHIYLALINLSTVGKFSAVKSLRTSSKRERKNIVGLHTKTFSNAQETYYQVNFACDFFVVMEHTVNIFFVIFT